MGSSWVATKAVATIEKPTADTYDILWRDAYTTLIQFIDATPSIDISPNKTVLPEDVRGEFYRLFDAARTAFVKENCPAVLSHGLELSQQYKAMQTKIISDSGLDSVEITGDLSWFLKDPVDGLRRFLFNPLSKLIANQMEILEFEQMASDRLSSACATLFREGYKNWVALGIIQRLMPGKSYRTPAIDNTQDVIMGEGHENPGGHIGDIPLPQEMPGFSFEQPLIVSFIVPVLALHSQRTSAFVALHTNFREAEWTARERPEMEWLDIGALKTEYHLLKLRPDLVKKEWYELEPILPDMALYTASDVNNLSMIADFKYMLRPDINIAIMDSAGWEEKVAPEDLKRRLLALNPRHGAFIICREEPSPEAVTTYGNTDSLKLIHVGFDESALETVVSLLTPSS